MICKLFGHDWKLHTIEQRYTTEHQIRGVRKCSRCGEIEKDSWISSTREEYNISEKHCLYCGEAIGDVPYEAWRIFDEYNKSVVVYNHQICHDYEYNHPVFKVLRGEISGDMFCDDSTMGT